MAEIRVPLYGMVSLSKMEWEIVNSKPFQRLRRIKQLAFSDFVYPGAVHTRFEHCIGVLYLASQAFDRICAKDHVRRLMRNVLGSDDVGFARQMVRLAALTHDLGHLPFSHAAEGILPLQSNGKPYKHENYSCAITEHLLKHILEARTDDENRFDIKSREVADFLSGRFSTKRLATIAPWRSLIDSELDCDRMDYLRRDSYHLGVQYGMFDVERVLSTLTLLEQPAVDEEEESTGQLVIGIEEGGLLAVESLILARYYMYEQVYFHKVRRYLDLQYIEAMRAIAAGKLLPPDNLSGLQIYLDMDDWTVQADLLNAAAAGNEAARRLTQRETMKVGYEMKDAGKADFLVRAEQLLQEHNIACLPDRSADKESQKFSISNIYVQGETSFKNVRPIANCSRVATAIPDKIYLGRLFVSSADRHRIKAEGILDGLLVEQEGGKDNE